MWAIRTYAPHFVTELMGVPRDLPLSRADRARLEEELDAIFPVSRRSQGVLFDAFTGNKAVNATPLEAVSAPTLVIHFRDDVMDPDARDRAEQLAGRVWVRTPPAERSSVTRAVEEALAQRRVPALTTGTGWVARHSGEWSHT